MKLVGVTSCPTGIAHTYMAAEALEQAAKDAGHEMIVETQGSAGSEPLDQSVIDAVDAAIFAHELEVTDRHRFDALPTVDIGVKKAIGGAAELIAEAAAKARSVRENGRAAWLLGFSFISEGAIPFAAADPMRVIAGSLVGSAVTGALVMQFGSTLRAPHGGLWVVPLMGIPLMFILAVLIGMAVMAAVVIALKSAANNKSARLATAESGSTGSTAAVAA